MQTALITSPVAARGVVGITMIYPVAAFGGRPSWGFPAQPSHPR